MLKLVAIIGSGYAGLHLALRLQQAGIKTSLFTDKTPQEIRASQLQNTVARFPNTIAREHELGIHDWDEVALNTQSMRVHINGEMPISFAGQIDSPASFLDTRINHARLQEIYAERGGEVIYQRMSPEALEDISTKYSLVVVASGGKALNSLFERLPEHSPYEQAQRILCSGYYRGIKLSEEDFNFIVSPGQGEIFQGTSYSFDGEIQQILLEGIPGGSFQPMMEVKYQDNPEKFKQNILQILRENAPTLYERIDIEKFEPTHAQDIVQGAITPVVRRAYSDLPNGKRIMAVGDAHVINDPIVGQGANTAVASAWILAQAIIEAKEFDAAFFEEAEAKIWDYAMHPTYWSNAFLMPPPDHVIGLMIAAMQNQALADAFCNGFIDPRVQWHRLSNPAHTAEFINSFEPVH